MPDFLLPDLGEGLAEAEVVSWRVQVGDHVDVDQPIVEVETAKAAVEVPVPFAGSVAKIHAAPGATVAVGQPLVTITADDPAADDPAAGDPAAGGPAAGDRAAGGPAAADGPAAAGPLAGEPAAAGDPGLGDPAAAPGGSLSPRRALLDRLALAQP
jgi:2-oxoisovalerate dehydrogenase E2 component (dihydrolipoyl transacylase)